jgi:hypothetical protein
MKQLLAAILLMIYFTVNTGFVVSMHYCMDKIDSVQIGAVESEKCNKCGMHAEDSDGCCRDEIKVLKLQQDPLVAKVLLPVVEQTPVELPISSLLITPFYNFQQADEYDHFRPPLISEQDTYLSNCVFRL